MGLIQKIKTRPAYKILAIAVIILLLAFLWWTVSPLFLNKTVEDELIGKIENRNAFSGGQIIQLASLHDLSHYDELEKKVLASGNFRDADSRHRGSGRFEIVLADDGKKYLQFIDFKVTNGPDLFVWISVANTPERSRDVRGKDYHNVGKLKGNKGNQVYALPDNFDESKYNSVVIWCRIFSVLFAAGDYE